MPPRPSICLQATPIRVIDGDTIEFEIKRTIKVRLRGIDCDEINTERGKLAKAFVEKKILPRQYPEYETNPKVIIYIPTDAHGNQLIDFVSFERVVGDVWINGENLKQLLKTKGFEKSGQS